MQVRMPIIEVSDEFRKALNYRDGRPGLATREDVRLWLMNGASADVRLWYAMNGASADFDVVIEFQERDLYKQKEN